MKIFRLWKVRIACVEPMLVVRTIWHVAYLTKKFRVTGAIHKPVTLMQWIRGVW